jgi:hypothetical protein
LKNNIAHRRRTRKWLHKNRKKAGRNRRQPAARRSFRAQRAAARGSERALRPAFFWDEETGEAVSANEYHRGLLSQEMFQRLEILRQEVVSIISSYRISVLDEPVLDLPVKGLRADGEVFLKRQLCVRDAFFFRGV